MMLTLDPPHIDRKRALPLWQQIESRLRDDISSGALMRGARLPSAGAMATRLGVNRHTVRRALAGLMRCGLLRVEPGLGTFVCDDVIDYPIGLRTRFRQNMDRLNIGRACEVLATAQIRPSARVAETMGLLSGEAAWRVEYLSHVDGRVFDHCEAFFATARFPHLDTVFRRTKSVTATLREFGIDDYFRRYTRVAARLPGANVAKLLEQPARRPVLEVESLNVDANDIPLQYGLTRFAGDRVHLLMSTND